MGPHEAPRGVACSRDWWAPTRLCRRSTCTAVGVDPSGGRSPWGLTLLEAPAARLLHMGLHPGPHSALSAVLRHAPRGRVLVVAVDSPLRLEPRGLRGVERLLARCTGVPLLPHGLGGMRRLHEAAAGFLRMLGEHYDGECIVVETYPAATARVLGVGRPRGRARHLADSLLAALAALAAAEGALLAVEEDGEAIGLPPPHEKYRHVALTALRSLF